VVLLGDSEECVYFFSLLSSTHLQVQHPLTRSFTHPPTYLHTYPPTHLPTHPPTHTPTHPHTHPPTFLLTHPPTHPLKSDSVRLVATAPIAGGSEILISYGDNLSNDDLLLDYGFVQRGNPSDRCPVRFDLGLVEMARGAGGVTRAFVHICHNNPYQRRAWVLVCQYHERDPHACRVLLSPLLIPLSDTHPPTFACRLIAVAKSPRFHTPQPHILECNTLQPHTSQRNAPHNHTHLNATNSRHVHCRAVEDRKTRGVATGW
jgi:hypothetical protein